MDETETIEQASSEALGDDTAPIGTQEAGGGPTVYPGWTLPGAENLSEFVPEPPTDIVRHGTCNELAITVSLHCLDPEAWPLNAESLAKVTDAMLAAGKASNPSGSSTPSEGAWFLSSIGCDYTYYGFKNPFPADLLSDILRSAAGCRPVHMEFAHAGMMRDDERGVFFHYEAALGGDPSAGVFSFGDGDALAVRISHGLGPLEVRGMADILAGVPCAVIVIEGWPMQIGQASEYFTQNDPGHWTVTRQGSPSNGLVVRGGILDAYRTWRTQGQLNGLSDWGLPLENEHPVPGMDPMKVSAQKFERCTVIWDKERLFDNPPGSTGEVYKAHVSSKIE